MGLGKFANSGVINSLITTQNNSIPLNALCVVLPVLNKMIRMR